MIQIGPTNSKMTPDKSNPIKLGSSDNSPASLLSNCNAIQPTQTSLFNLSDTQDPAPTEKTTLLTEREISIYRQAKSQITPEQVLQFHDISFLYARMLLQDTTQKLNLKSNESSNYYPLHEILLKKNWTGFEKLDIVQLMLKYKTAEGQALDINAIDKKGRTVLLITLFDLYPKNKDSIVYELLTHGVDIGLFYKTPDSTGTVLHLAIDQYSKKQTKLTTTHFEQEKEKHILLTAQLEQIFDMIELLLKFYTLSNFQTVDSKNNTVLMCAQKNKLDHIVNAIQTRQLALEAMKTTPLSQPESKLPLQHKPKFNFPALVPMSSTHNLEFLKACKAGDFAKVQALLKPKTETSDEVIDFNLGFFTHDDTMISTGFLYVLTHLVICGRKIKPQNQNTSYLDIARHILKEHKQQIDLTLVNGSEQTALNIILENPHNFSKIKEEMVSLILDNSSKSCTPGKPNNINHINRQGYSYLCYSMTTPRVTTRIINQLIDQGNIDFTMQYRLPVRGGTILHQLIYFSTKKTCKDNSPVKSFSAFRRLLNAITDSSILKLTNKDNESVWLYAQKQSTQCFNYLCDQFHPKPSDQKTISAHAPSKAAAFLVPNSKILSLHSNRKRVLPLNSSSLLPGPSIPPSALNPPENKKQKKDSNDVMDSQDPAPAEKTTLLTESEILTYRQAQPQITPEQALQFHDTSFLYARMLLQDTTQKLNLKSNESLNYYPLHEILLKKNWTGFEKLEIVQLMLKYRTAEGQALDINATDKEGRTVLLIALFYLHTKNKDSIVYELLTHGADIEFCYTITDHESNGTILHFAIEQYSITHTQLTTISCNNTEQEYIMLTDQLEQTFDIIELLLKFYKLSDFKITDCKNKTVLMCAQEKTLDNIVNAIQTRQLALEAMKTTPLTQPESKLPLQHKPKFNFPALVPMSSTHNLEFLKACKAGDLAKVQELLKPKTETSDEAIDFNLGFFTHDDTMISTGFLYVLTNLVICGRKQKQQKQNTSYLDIARYILKEHKQQIDLTLVNGFEQTALNIILEDPHNCLTIKEEMVSLILENSSKSCTTGKPNNINHINRQGYSYLCYSMTTPRVNTRIINQLIDQENIDLTMQYRLPVRGGTILHQLIYFSTKQTCQHNPQLKSLIAFSRLLNTITNSSILDLTNKDNESVWLYAQKQSTHYFKYLCDQFHPNPSDQKNFSAHAPSEAAAFLVPNSKILSLHSNRKRVLPRNSSSLLPGPSIPPSPLNPPENKKQKKDSNDVMDSPDEDPGVVMASPDEDSQVVMVSPDEDSNVVMASQYEDLGVFMASQSANSMPFMDPRTDHPFLIPLELIYLNEESDLQNNQLSLLKPRMTTNPLSFDSLLESVAMMPNPEMDT